METQKPTVYIGEQAYAAACTEFARWAAWGQSHGGAAWEAVLYPLVGVVPRDGGGRSPLEPTSLSECAALVVAGVVVPPPALAHYGPTWARPRQGATEAAAAELHAALDAVRARYPRLDCYGRMHSHPWPHRTPHPSGTDCAEHLTGALASNQAAGLPWSLGLIAAAPDVGVNWPIQAYGLEPGGKLTDLGQVQVVSEADVRVRAVQAGARWAGVAGRRWLVGQTAALASRGLTVMALPLHRGWYGLAWRTALGEARLLALPPSFPARPPRLLRLTAGGVWMGATLTGRARRLAAYDLQAIITGCEAA